MSLNQRGWERCGWKFYRRASELGTQELTPTPDPSSDPYEWKVGDQIWKPDGFVTTIEKVHLDGTITLWDRTGVYTLEELRKHGWKLHRKASELGVQELTPQQVAGFAAVTEPIDDSVGTDEEGQS
jgi:WD40 repeat protein